MYTQYYSYANVILILTVHGINCKDEREHGKAVIMNLFKISLAVTNIIAKMYSQPLKYVIKFEIAFSNDTYMQRWLCNVFIPASS